MSATAADRAVRRLGLVSRVEKPGPAAPNLLLLVPPGAEPVEATLTNGTLRCREGGLALEAADAPRRLVAVPGIGCTPLDVARALAPTLAGIRPEPGDAPPAPLEVAELARALCVYGARALAPSHPPKAEPTPGALRLDEWWTGVLLTLPFELDDAGRTWVTEISAIKEWASEYGSWAESASIEPARELEIPDPLALRKTVTAAVATAPLGPLADRLRARLLSNPFEVVFELCDVLRVVRARRPAELLGLVLQLCDARLTHGQAAVLGATTAGNAALRQLFAVLDGARGTAGEDVAKRRTAALATLGKALGLKPDPDGPAGEWLSPARWGPRVVPVEPPLDPAHATESVDEDKRKNVCVCHAFLGRVVRVARANDRGKDEESTHCHLGTAAFDPLKVAREWPAEQAGLLDVALGPTGRQVPAPKVKARIDVSARVSSNEGFLDSCQAGDGGIVSFGLQQWAAHTDADLTVLWERYRVADPVGFDLFFGTGGVLTERSDGGGATPGDATAYFPDSATFLYVATDTKPEPLKAGRDGDRRLFFIGEGTASSAAVPRGDRLRWCARARLAALCSLELQRVQLHTAAWRWTLALELLSAPFEVPVRPPVPALGPVLKCSIAELFPSTFGAALVLDHHVNLPDNVLRNIRQAIARVPGRTCDAAGKLDARWLERLSIDYLGVRNLGRNTATRCQGMAKRHDLSDETRRLAFDDPFEGW